MNIIMWLLRGVAMRLGWLRALLDGCFLLWSLGMTPFHFFVIQTHVSSVTHMHGQVSEKHASMNK